MILIKFNDSDVLHKVQFSREGNIITLEGIADVNTTGFTTWRMDGKTQLGDFSGYITAYRVMENAVQYSNDGKIWVEPDEDYVPPTQPIDPKDQKIAELEEKLAAISAAILNI